MMGCLRSIGCLAILVILAAGAYVTRDMWMERPAFGPWEPLSADGAATARRAIERLATPKGPAYVQMTGAQFASYALKDRLPGDAQAAVIDDQLHVRERGLVELAGTIDVPRSGVGQFRATEIKVGSVALPSAAIPRLFHGADSATVGLPTAVGDIRVAHGHITLYKKIP